MNRKSQSVRVLIASVVALALSIGVSGCSRQADFASDPARFQQEPLPRLYATLLAGGIAEATAKRILLATLRPPHEPSPFEYWKPSRSTAQADPEHWSDETRNELVKLFGASVSDDPAFTHVFKPYAHRYPFLSSEKQLRLQQILASTPSQRPAAFGQREFQIRRKVHAEQRAAIEQLLSPEELFEYDLRESASSQRLALSGFEFSESEFRAVYEIVAKLPPGTSGLPSGVDRFVTSGHEPALRELLGDRFEEFMRAQDANYQMFAAIGAEHGVDTKVIGEAYAIVRSTEERLEQLRLMGPLTREKQTPEQILEERDAQLRSLLGGGAFDAITRMMEARTAGRPTGMVVGSLR